MRTLSRIVRSAAFAGAAAALFATAVSAGVVIVDPTGFGDAETIQGGIDLASEGDTLLVAAATYSGQGNQDLDFRGLNVHMISLGGCGTTIVDCGGLGRGMLFDGGQDTTCTIEGITIRNALADSGGAVFCRNFSGPKFISCVFEASTATYWGGGMFCFKSSPVLLDCVFESNESIGDGGRSGGYGGGLSCDNSASPRLEECDFVDNEAVSVGGGVSVTHWSEPLFVDCTFVDNHTDDNSGGAFYGGTSSHVTFTDCSFVGNHGLSGGAFHTQSCDITATRCTFAENTAQYVGAVTHTINPATHSYEECTFYRNSTTGIAAVMSYFDTDLTMHRCTISGNSAGGMTVFRLNDTSPVITNTIIAFSEGEPISDCDGTAAPTFDKCVLFENDGADSLCGTVLDTLIVDPRFCGVEEDDFTLCQNSRCLDTENAWGEMVGAHGQGCGPCDSAVEPATWGRVKAIYR